MNYSVDIALFVLVVAFPIGMTGLLVTGYLELWLYLCLQGAILLWGIDLAKKLEK